MTKKYYDQIDMRNTYNAGFWIGATAGILGMFILCFTIGVYFANFD